MVDLKVKNGWIMYVFCNYVLVGQSGDQIQLNINDKVSLPLHGLGAL